MESPLKPVLTLPEATAYLLLALKVPTHEARATKDKIHKRLKYAIKQQDLPHLTPGPKFTVPTGQFLLWAKEKWPNELAELKLPHEASVQESVKFQDSARCDSIPADLPKCKQALRDAYDEIELLDRSLRKAFAEVERLRPYTERYLYIRANNRKSARRSRK